MRKKVRSVCVYCGSSVGAKREYAEAARGVGRLLAERGITLVYGGGSIGLMGVLADAALGAGGKVVGVIPQGLRTRELAHEGLSELITVESMHARKQTMVDRSDAFIALPGGIGTLDELFETFTWLQLGIHDKPVGILNAAGYYLPLIELIRNMAAERFLKQEHFDCLLIDDDIERLVDRLQSFSALGQGKWVQAPQRLEP
ncbi:MAG: TIGR00730 family Rossman fold protein [Burkholderiales bacterium]